MRCGCIGIRGRRAAFGARGFRTDTFEQVATIQVGALPHGLWPSGDGTRMYVGLENADAVAVLDTSTNTLVTEIPIGQGAQGVAYVPNAVSDGATAPHLEPLGLAGEKATLSLRAIDGHGACEVTLFDQGTSATGCGHGARARPALRARAGHGSAGQERARAPLRVRAPCAWRPSHARRAMPAPASSA